MHEIGTFSLVTPTFFGRRVLGPRARVPMCFLGDPDTVS